MMYQLSIDDLLENTRAIPLFRPGRRETAITIVSACDYDYLTQWRWHLQMPGYAARRPVTNGKPTQILMHRVIVNCPDGLVVDHINGNGLDNRRSNLRVCNHQQNIQNRRKRHDSVSRYKGITPSKTAGKWLAYIFVDGKNRNLGTFPSELDAALAYDAAAREIFGEFAKTNF